MQADGPQIAFLRHGSTSWNEERRWQGGEVDPPLSKPGRHQVYVLGRELKRYGLSSGYSLASSSMIRAVETAEILRSAGVGSGEIETLDALREARLGTVCGLTEEEVELRFPEVFGDWTSGRVPLYPRGESPGEMAGRISQVLTVLVQRQAPIVVIVHMMVLRAIRLLVGVPRPQDEGHLSGIGLWVEEEHKAQAVWMNITPTYAALHREQQDA